MKKKSEAKNDGNILTEIENLTELIEREKASVTILLIAASGDSEVDTDDVCLIMRDSHDRVEKMEKSLEHLSEMVL